MAIPVDLLVNDFAIRCFRDVADGDYIAARMACRAELVVQYLWAAQQCVEKYLKCILLLNRIPAVKMRHDLRKGLELIEQSRKIDLSLPPGTREYIEYLDDYGQSRYLEISTIAFGHGLPRLDRAVWRLRRFCTLDLAPRRVEHIEGFPPPKIRLQGGTLEEIMDSQRHWAREALLWQNGFFGRKVRKHVRLRNWMRATNSPLSIHPEILDEVSKYVLVPGDIAVGYRALHAESAKSRRKDQP